MNTGKIYRLDSLPAEQTYFTAEGYLMDNPILTGTGIFEYFNEDGSVRRELRLPEEVFSEESLRSYKGKPIIITHGAGLIDKENVSSEAIGTVLTEGYRDGCNVRAQIVIHSTDEMKDCGYKELSLGYNLDLEETPGEWEGQHYDAIQRNIRINHLALVREARAGEKARLNIDSRENKYTFKGVKIMDKKKSKGVAESRGDGVLSPEELETAIAEYRSRRASAKTDETDGDEPENSAEHEGTETQPSESRTIEEQVEAVKERQDNRDESDPAAVIAKQDEDMGILFDIIDTLLAEREYNSCKADSESESGDVAEPAENTDSDSHGESSSGEDYEKEETAAPADEAKGAVNADSIDAIVRQRIKLGLVGRALNLDGLENMRITEAKKVVIRAVRPELRLDGKSPAYINAAFDCAAAEVESGAHTHRTAGCVDYQKRQMFNKDSAKAHDSDSDSQSSGNARLRMIARQQKTKED